MKIVGGEAKNRGIKVPKGIRPTQGKVRAVIFDVLGDEVWDSKFIDLFAGSGAVGIEALSRGAKEAIFVEHSQRVVKVIRDNLELLGYSDKAKIIVKNAITIAKELLNPSTPQSRNSIAITFADPPYNEGYIKKLTDLLLVSQPIKFPDLFIIEHSKHEPMTIGEHYKAGDSIITFIWKERRAKWKN